MGKQTTQAKKLYYSVFQYGVLQKMSNDETGDLNHDRSNFVVETVFRVKDSGGSYFKHYVRLTTPYNEKKDAYLFSKEYLSLLFCAECPPECLRNGFSIFSKMTFSLE